MKASLTLTLAAGAATGTSAFQIPIVARQSVAAPSRTSLSMSSATGSGKGLDYNPDKYADDKNKGNYRRLSDALQVRLSRSALRSKAAAYGVDFVTSTRQTVFVMVLAQVGGSLDGHCTERHGRKLDLRDAHFFVRRLRMTASVPS